MVPKPARFSLAIVITKSSKTGLNGYELILLEIGDDLAATFDLPALGTLQARDASAGSQPSGLAGQVSEHRGRRGCTYGTDAPYVTMR